MQSEIFENGQLNVEILNITASDEEINKLRECILTGIGKINSPPTFLLDGASKKGNRYTVSFSVRGPRHFNISSVKKWLDSIGFVGYEIAAQAGPKYDLK